MSQHQTNQVCQKDELSHMMMKAASILMLCGLLTGLYMSLVAMKVIEAEFSMVLSAHLNALLGSFWIIAVSYSLKFCQSPHGYLQWMSRMLILANFSNWLITLIKAHLHVAGIQFTEESSNNIIVITLSLLVVIPALLSSILWIQALFTQRIE